MRKCLIELRVVVQYIFYEKWGNLWKYIVCAFLDILLPCGMARREENEAHDNVDDRPNLGKMQRRVALGEMQRSGVQIVHSYRSNRWDERAKTTCKRAFFEVLVWYCNWTWSKRECFQYCADSCSDCEKLDSPWSRHPSGGWVQLKHTLEQLKHLRRWARKLRQRAIPTHSTRSSLVASSCCHSTNSRHGRESCSEASNWMFSIYGSCSKTDRSCCSVNTGPVRCWRYRRNKGNRWLWWVYEGWTNVVV